MAFFKQNWLTILFFTFVVGFLGTTLVTRQCPSCVIESAFKDNTADGTPPQSVAWETKLIDETPVSSQVLNEHVSVLVYFATWCGPCIREIPHLIDLRNTFQADKVNILAISMDQPGKDLASFVEKHDINYQIARNSPSLDESYGPVKYLPTILIIDQKGEIIHRHIGGVSGDTLETQVRTLLMEEA